MTDSIFEPLDGKALVCKGGVYKEEPIFVYENLLYARHGSGYVRLYKNHTSAKGQSVIKIIGLKVEETPRGMMLS